MFFSIRRKICQFIKKILVKIKKFSQNFIKLVANFRIKDKVLKSNHYGSARMKLQKIYLFLFLCFLIRQHLFSNDIPPYINIQGHQGSIYSVAFSPDGKWIASGGKDNQIKIWDFTNKREIITLRGHKHFVHTVLFSPDGKFLATCGNDNIAIVWDLSTFKDIYYIPSYSTNNNCSISFSINGKYIATIDTGKSKNIKLWDVFTGKEIDSIEVIATSPIAISPNDKYIAFSSPSGDIKIYNNTTKNILTLRKNKLPIRAISFHPLNNVLITGSIDGLVKIWDLFTGKEIKTLELRNSILAIAISPNGKIFAVGMMDGKIPIWNNNYHKILDLQTNEEMIHSITFSPDSKYLAAGGENAIHLWDLSNIKTE